MYDRSVFVLSEVKQAEVTAVGRDATSSNTERAVPEYQISDHHTVWGEGSPRIPPRPQATNMIWSLDKASW